MFFGKPHIRFLTKLFSDVSWLGCRRLADLNFRYMNDLFSGDMVRGLPILKFDNDHLCAACEYGKESKKCHLVLTEKSIFEPLKLLHIDLCGPVAAESLHYKKYILVIVNDFTQFTWVFFLILKSEMTSKLINFIKGIEVLKKLTVRRVHNDNKTKITNSTFEN